MRRRERCVLSQGMKLYVTMGTHRDSNEWQLSALFPNSHFPNLFAIVAQDLEKPVQDLWQVIQQVNVWHRHQNQDLMEGSSERMSWLESWPRCRARFPVPFSQGQQWKDWGGLCHGTAVGYGKCWQPFFCSVCKESGNLTSS